MKNIKEKITTNFQVKAIPYSTFQHLFTWDKKQLAEIGAKRMIVESHPGYPCRVSLADAEIGEEVVLFTYEHHAVVSPYRAAGAIFIRKNATIAKLAVNEIPQILHHRFLSLRAYDAQGMMTAAHTTMGKNILTMIGEIFVDSNIQYIQVHNANPGCYNCQIDRVA